MAGDEPEQPGGLKAVSDLFRTQYGGKFDILTLGIVQAMHPAALIHMVRFSSVSLHFLANNETGNCAYRPSPRSCGLR